MFSLKKYFIIFCLLFLFPLNSFAIVYDVVDEYKVNDKNSSVYLISKDDKYGVVSKDKKIILPVEYDSISINKYFNARKDDKSYLYSIDGSQILNNTYDSIIVYGDVFIVKKDNKFGLINENNNIIVPLSYTNYDMVYGNYIIFSNKTETVFYKNGKLINLPYSDSKFLSFECILVNNNSLQGLYSTQEEKLVIPAKFDELKFLKSSANKFIVAKKNDKYWLYDNSGKLLLDIIFKQIEVFYHCILVKKQNDKYNLYFFKSLENIFSDEDYIVPKLWSYNDCYFFAIKKDSKYGIIKYDNKTSIKSLILPYIYDDVIFTYPNCILKLNNKWIAYDLKTDIPKELFIFDNIENKTNIFNYYFVKIDGKDYMYNYKELVEYVTYERKNKDVKIDPISSFFICVTFKTYGILYNTTKFFENLLSDKPPKTIKIKD